MTGSGNRESAVSLVTRPWSRHPRNSDSIPSNNKKFTYAVHSPTNALSINMVKSFKFTLKYTIISLLHVSVLMTIIRELYLHLNKVIFMLKHSVKLRRYIS